MKKLVNLFKNRSKEELLRVIDLLPEKRKHAVIMKNGTNLECDFHIDGRNNINYNYAIQDIERYFKEKDMGSKGISIEYYIPGVDKKQIFITLDKLDQWQKELIIYRFGKKLDTINPDITYEQRREINKLLKNIKFRTNSEDVTNSVQSRLLTERYSNQSISKLKEIVDTKLLPEQREAIYLRYGDNLDTYIKNLDSKTNARLSSALARIDKYFELEKECIDTDLTQIKEILSKLPDDDRLTLTNAYGEDLSNYDESKVQDVNKVLKTINNSLKRYIKYDNTDFNNNKYPKMCKYYSNYPVKYVILAINKLPKMDRLEVIKAENSDGEIKDILQFSILNKLTLILRTFIIEWKYDYYNDVRKYTKIDSNILTRELIDNAIDEKLDEKYKTIIDKVRKKIDLSKSEIMIYKRAIKLIGESLKMKKETETIYKFFKEFSKEEINDAIERLGNRNKKELRLRYGNDLNNPKRDENYTKDNTENFLRNVLPELKAILNKEIEHGDNTVITVKINPLLFKKKEETKKKVEIEQEKETPKSLKELFSEIPISHLKTIVSILPNKYQDIIYKRHTKDLDEYIFFEGANFTKLVDLYNEAFVVLDKAIDIYKQPLSKLCTIDKEEFENNISKLTERQLSVLNKVHGDTYSYTLPLCVLDSGEKKIYARIITLLNQKKVVTPKKEKVKTESKKTVERKGIDTLFEGHTISEIKEAISYLTDIRKEAIYKKYGINLDEYNSMDSQVEHSTIYLAIKDIEKVFAKDKALLNRKLSNRYSEFTMEEIIETIKSLPEERQKLLYERHGINLDEYHDVLKDGNYNELSTTYTILKRKLDKKKLLKEQQLAKELQFKSDMVQKYRVLFNESLSVEEIEYIVDLAMKDYDNNIDRERYIINHLYNYLKELIKDNQDILEQIFIQRQKRK